MGTRWYQDVEWEDETDREHVRPELDWGRGLMFILVVVFLVAVTSAAWAGGAQDAHRRGHRDRGAHATAQGVDPAGDDAEVLGEIIVGPPPPQVTKTGVTLIDIIITSMLLTLSGAGAYACARSLWESHSRARAEARHISE